VKRVGVHFDCYRAYDTSFVEALGAVDKG